MRPKAVKDLLKRILSAPIDKSSVLYLEGDPGIGKSQIVRQSAEEAAVEMGVPVGLIDIRLSQRDPTDLRGIPVPDMVNQTAVWLSPSELPREGRGLLFLDELALAPPLVQASAFQLILDRKLGEYYLPDDWRMVAAGNDPERTGLGYALPAPLRNRLTHIKFQPEFDDWRQWAITAGIAPQIIEFLTFSPSSLFKYDHRSKQFPFPSPRSWERFSNNLFLYFGNDSHIVFEALNGDAMDALCGDVGESTAGEFRAFIRDEAYLPSINEILEGKDILASRPDIQMVLVSGLVLRAKPEQAGRLMAYATFLSNNNRPDVAMMLVRLMLRRFGREILEQCPDEYRQWAHVINKYVS